MAENPKIVPCIPPVGYKGQWNRKNPESLSETRIEIRQRRKNYESSYFSTFPQNLDEFHVKYG